MSDERDVEHRMIDAGDGLVLHVQVAGQGTPVVLLHGFTGSVATWDALREQLAGEHRLIAIDLPGHGRSPTPADPARLALPRCADDLARVLDALDIERSALLGYSLGGRVALHVAVRHAARLSALVLESASPGIADPAERMRRLALDADLAADIEQQDIDTFVNRWEALPLWASQRTLSGPVRAGLRAQRLANDPLGLAASLRGAGAASEPALSVSELGFTVPTLLVAGSLDARYVAIARALEATLTDATLVVVAEAGHAVHLERPLEFAAVVRDFLRAR